jgi:hypothetical protein
MQAPVTVPLGPGVMQGSLGAAPRAGDGSVIATTTPSAAMLSPRLVAISQCPTTSSVTKARPRAESD